jgi:hypothetical protein
MTDDALIRGMGWEGGERGMAQVDLGVHDASAERWTLKFERVAARAKYTPEVTRVVGTTSPK